MRLQFVALNAETVVLCKKYMIESTPASPSLCLKKKKKLIIWVWPSQSLDFNVTEALRDHSTQVFILENSNVADCRWPVAERDHLFKKTKKAVSDTETVTSASHFIIHK